VSSLISASDLYTDDYEEFSNDRFGEDDDELNNSNFDTANEFQQSDNDSKKDEKDS
jgi:hypothetical protein